MALNLSRYNLDCNACNEYQKEDRGCIKDSPIPGRWKVGTKEYNRCPVKLVNAESNIWINTYNFMEKGILPRYGGWLDQTNKFVSVMSLINSEIANINKEGHRGK